MWLAITYEDFVRRNLKKKGYSSQENEEDGSVLRHVEGPVAVRANGYGRKMTVDGGTKMERISTRLNFRGRLSRKTCNQAVQF